MVYVDEEGWLIEGRQKNAAVWLGQLFGALEWTTNSEEAIRFSRKKDGVNLIRVLPPEVSNSSDTPLVVTDHVWEVEG
jgi:hypothetical protein